MTHRTTRSRAGRTAALVAVLLLGVGLVPPLANAAGVRGATTGTSSVTAGTWGVTAATTSMVFTLSLDQSSKVTDTGSVALVAQSYSVTVSTTALGSPTFRVFQCAVAWVANLCSLGLGTPVGGTLATPSTTLLTSTTALAVGAAVYLQVEPLLVLSSTTVTLSTRVTSPGQLRAPIRTNQ